MNIFPGRYKHPTQELTVKKYNCYDENTDQLLSGFIKMKSKNGFQ